MADLVNIVIPPLGQPYTYVLPDELRSAVGIGSSVEVPLGKRFARGFVIARSQEALESANEVRPYKLKTVRTGGEHHPCFQEKQLTLFNKVAEYYGDHLSNVLDVAIPTFSPPRVERLIAQMQPQPEIAPRGQTQRAILELLRTRKEPVLSHEISTRFKGAAAILRALTEKGYITIASREMREPLATAESAPVWAKREIELNEMQALAAKQIAASAAQNEFKTFLIHGVTGSGKTEVYIEVIRQLLAVGRGALVIVPEIALTPQLIDRFQARLGNEIAVLHSALNKRLRWAGWQALMENRCRVAIGARSAVFAPIQNLGLIIVDEEHDQSFKQSEGLRYNGRDVAVLRGKLESCPVVLGSATPSLESFQNAAAKRYQYVELPARFGAAERPQIELVDLQAIKPWEMPSKNVSPVLFEALRETLERDEQSFVLYNRRGFASYLQCEKCNAVIECPNCSVTLTYHQHSNSLICHYCGTTSVRSDFCPHCQIKANTNLKLKTDEQKHAAIGTLTLRGAGTEKVLEEIQQLFPEARLARLDRDAVTSIDQYRAILDDVRTGKTQVLVGTQMISKGHDLPNVTLVGIVDCDVGLHMPDFRAAERVFQLLTQSAGRAGRSTKPGRVILQTRVPKHVSLQMTASDDYRSFAQHELANRKELSYPPYSRMLRIVASHLDKEVGLTTLNTLRDLTFSWLEKNPESRVTILGPAPAPLARLKAVWRWHLLLKSQRASSLHEAMRLLRHIAVTKFHNVKITFDIDPQDML